MGKLNKYPLQKIMFGLIILIVLIGGITGCSNETVQFLESELEMEEIVQLTPGAVSDEDETEIFEENELKPKQEESIEEQKVFVYVCGAVLNPGVYEMEINSRVFQAVEMAGGLLQTAVPEYVNQAMIVTDGQQIYIPSQSEIDHGDVLSSKSEFTDGVKNASNLSGSSTKVNINTADKTELMTISGIGESRAQDIIDYRQQRGGFSTIEEIMNVPGIKDATFEKIKDSIEVK